MSSEAITKNDLITILNALIPVDPSNYLIGEIKPYGGVVVPNGWLPCDGREVLIDDYELLYAAIGNTWGTPSDSDYFVLPDLRGKVPFGLDSGNSDFYPVGKTGGNTSITVGMNNMPAHNHGSVSLAGNSGGSVFGGGQGSTASGIMTRAYSTGRQYKTDGTGSNGWYWLYVDASHTHATQGSGQAIKHIQPYAVVQYIICAATRASIIIDGGGSGGGGGIDAETDPIFTASPAYNITSQTISTWNNKSDFSGSYSDLTNKPSIPEATSTTPQMDGTASVGSETTFAKGDHVHPSDVNKQDLLESGVNIKTINNEDILGSGNITIQGGAASGTSTPTADTVAEFDSNAKMNSTDMGSSDVSTFVNSLAVNNVTPTLLDMFYPVGTIYQTLSVTFNPNTAWGGTWVKIEEGRFLQATETSTDVGDTVSAGLPNITGAWWGSYGESGVAGGSGALSVYSNGSYKDGFGTGWKTGMGISLDASRSSSIYGNSNTVQPPSIEVYMWKRTA